MTGPGSDRTAAGGHGHLRASHADRDRVISQLKAAYVYGLVTKDEFDARVGQTFASRTYAELALVTEDIPAGLPALPARLSGGAPAGAAAPAQRMLTAATATTAVTAILALGAALFLANPAAGLLVIFAVGSTSVSMLLLRRLLREASRRVLSCRADQADAARSHRPRPQLAG
jgi:hypothetical protein